jgi:hypothetical protein
LCKIEKYSTTKLHLQYHKAGFLKRYLYTHVRHDYSNSQRQKQPESPLTVEWVNKIWAIYIMEYYSVLIKNEILTCYNMNET